MSFRDENALINKHKKMVQELRVYSSWQRRNALRTGGGPAEPKPASIKMEITGALLELQQFYGHALCGMDGFDSDGISNHLLQTDIPSSQLQHDDIPPPQLLSGEDTSVTCVTSASIRSARIKELLGQFVDDSPEPFDPLPPNGSIQTDESDIIRREVPLRATETVTSVTQTHTNGPSTAAVAMTTSDAAATSGAAEMNADVPELSQQYFPTCAQQRRRRINQQQQNNNEQKQSTAELLELRQQFVIEEREHYRAKHELQTQNQRELHLRRLQVISDENRARLAEIKNRNDIRNRIATKQLQFWEVAIAFIQANPRAQHDLQQAAVIAEEVHELEQVAQMEEQANDAVEAFHGIHQAEDYLEESDDSIQSAFDDVSDRDYMP